MTLGENASCRQTSQQETTDTTTLELVDGTLETREAGKNVRFEPESLGSRKRTTASIVSFSDVSHGSSMPVSDQQHRTRHRLSTPAAEQIAQSADRIEAQAAEVRRGDKRLALKLLKEATRLRHFARALDIQHKRAIRTVLQRTASGRDAARADAELVDAR